MRLPRSPVFAFAGVRLELQFGAVVRERELADGQALGRIVEFERELLERPPESGTSSGTSALPGRAAAAPGVWSRAPEPQHRGVAARHRRSSLSAGTRWR